MLRLLAALTLTGQPAAPPDNFGPGRTATVFSTVGQSEWCPAGNVWLDLSTGEYIFTARASRLICSKPDLERPSRKGRLDPARLAALRSAYRRAQAEGLDDCRDGRRGRIVFSNGGPQILVLTSGARSTAAPDELGCWTEAAEVLHRTLSSSFPSPR